MNMGLNDKVVLVTGSSSGIGRSTAVAFGQEGARVAVTYHTGQAGAEETAESVKANGGEAIVIPYDMAEPSSIQTAVDLVVARWGAIHVLVNNSVPREALNLSRGNSLFEDVPPEVWQRVLRPVLEGVYMTVQAVLPSMRAQGWGRIVNVSSNLAERGAPKMGPYAASKAGIHGLTKVLAEELGPAGIFTNAVLPGAVLTDNAPVSRSSQLREVLEKGTPTGRITTPEEVASLILYLGSAANGHVNGEIVRVTGGRY